MPRRGARAGEGSTELQLLYPLLDWQHGTIPDREKEISVVSRVIRPSSVEDDFDYSTPQAEAAIRAANAMVLELARPLARKVALYERTLGLAVIPVLLRRAILGWWIRRRGQHLSAR